MVEPSHTLLQTDIVLLHFKTASLNTLATPVKLINEISNFYSKGNTTTVGSSIHASTVEHCHRHLNCSTDLTNLFNCIANFTFPKNDGNSVNHQLTTSGVKFIVNDSILPLRVIPGKSFDILITMG